MGRRRDRMGRGACRRGRRRAAGGYRFPPARGACRIGGGHGRRDGRCHDRGSGSCRRPAGSPGRDDRLAPGRLGRPVRGPARGARRWRRLRGAGARGRRVGGAGGRRARRRAAPRPSSRRGVRGRIRTRRGGRIRDRIWTRGGGRVRVRRTGAPRPPAGLQSLAHAWRSAPEPRRAGRRGHGLHRQDLHQGHPRRPARRGPQPIAGRWIADRRIADWWIADQRSRTGRQIVPARRTSTPRSACRWRCSPRPPAPGAGAGARDARRRADRASSPRSPSPTSG